MAATASTAADASVNANSHERRQNALADIQFASILDDDDLTPVESGEETEQEQRLELETVQSAIGVSIGQQQTRLTSPKTPAAEKAAALEDAEGGALFDGWEQQASAVIDARARRRVPSPGELDERRSAKAEEQPKYKYGSSPESDEALERLPSPWRAGPKIFQGRMSDHRASLRQHLNTGRRRASSSGSMAEAVRRYVPFNLPKAPKHLQFSLPSFSALSLDHERGKPAQAGMSARPKQIDAANMTSMSQQDGASESKLGHRRSLSSPQQVNAAPLPQGEIESDRLSTLPPRSTPRVSHDRSTPRLRRSNSEGSLLLYRTKSIASSLGDDSRFESVSEQVNSRLKAIKDSFQDSNFKLPSPSLPNFNFSHREDLSRSRNGSAPPRSRTTDELPSRKPNLRPSASTFPRNGSSVSLKAMRPFKDSSAEADNHPNFTQALEELEGDLVILGGYRGSILRSAEPPHRQLWVPIKVGLNLRKVDLEVPFDEGADERMEQTIIPDGMLTHIGPVDISKRLFKRLRASENFRNGKLRVHNYGYDWRLSPHFLSQRLINFLKSLPCNQANVPAGKKGAIVIAHSLGGLITRHAINQRPDLVAGVVYAGVPQNCVNILGPFRNGDDVLLSSRVLTAQVNFSIRTSYALLPLDGKCFINKHTKEEYPVDFFDINTWIEGRLSPCIAPPLPRLEPTKEGTFSVSSVLSAMSQALPAFPSRKGSMSRGSSEAGNSVRENIANKVAEGNAEAAGGRVEPQMMAGRRMSRSTYTTNDPNPATAVTISRDDAIKYLTRVLAETKRFKEELAHEPKHSEANEYPPIALMYGKSTPTVFGAKVESREAIARADVYDELAFASGDGVVLARAAMVPPGYSVVRGGVVSSDRGHVTLLGDLEGVGRCLRAVVRARRAGLGLGRTESKAADTDVRDSQGLGIQVPQIAV